jgi:hypothetical protein
MYCRSIRVLRAESLSKSQYPHLAVVASRKTSHESLTLPIQSSAFHNKPLRVEQIMVQSLRTDNEREIESQVFPIPDFDFAKTVGPNAKRIPASYRPLVGLTGGQIVCEMLRRQNVDSICKLIVEKGGERFPFTLIYKPMIGELTRCKIYSRIPWWSNSASF